MSAKKSYIKIWVFLLMVIAFIGIDGMAVVHAQETGQTIQEVLKASSPEDMVQIADALHATWDADSGQLILQEDVSLAADVILKMNDDLTIDLNGHQMTDGVIDIYSGGIVTFQGSGALVDCKVRSWQHGTVILAGDIRYEHRTEAPIILYDGSLIIENGELIGTAKPAFIAQGDHEGYETPEVCVRGGKIYGGISISFGKLTVEGGTLKDGIRAYCSRVNVSGGTITGGIRVLADSDSGFGSLTVSGGLINGQVQMERPVFTMTGGTIKAAQSPVIEAGTEQAVNESVREKIHISGGTIISTKAGGTGIRVYSANVRLSGGTIKNATGTGKYGVYACNYTDQVTFKYNKTNCKLSGFSVKTKTVDKSNYCGKQLTYKYDKRTATLTVSGTGEMFYGMCFWEYDDISQMRHVVIGKGVTSIAGSVFSYSKQLQDVKMADTVTAIAVGAFSNCPKLKTVTFSKNLRTIGAYAFMVDRSLTEAVLPNTVESVGDQCFFGCKSMKRLVLSDRMTIVPQYMCQNCVSLTKVDIPKSVAEIGRGAFVGCKKLENVTFHKGLQDIGIGAFLNCSSIKKITIPSSVAQIQKRAFQDCEKLSEVTIKAPEYTTVAADAFCGTPYALTNM